MQVARTSDVLFIAVKPQYVATVLREVSPLMGQQSVVVSIAAGITLQTLKVRRRAGVHRPD